jgi:DNA-binding XRE family transcriptional regulator
LVGLAARPVLTALPGSVNLIAFLDWNTLNLYPASTIKNTNKLYFNVSSLESMAKVETQSEEMSPARIRRLIAELEAWRKANHIKQKDLADSLGMSPQQLNNIIKDRHDPTGEQALHMQELIRTKPVEKPKPSP